MSGNSYQENQRADDSLFTPAASSAAGGAMQFAQKAAVPVSNPTDNKPELKLGKTENDEGSGDTDVRAAQRFIPPVQLQKNNLFSPPPFKPIQTKQNNTGLPDNLKSGVEKLSGASLSDVKVHYNSSKPVQFNAFAYAQGSDIHVASGQERHLPHEAWHVAQQKQGKVAATTQMKGVAVNDDQKLEKEADEMGAKAMSVAADPLASGYEHFNKADVGDVKSRSALANTTQRRTFENLNSEIAVATGKLNSSNNTTIQRETVQQLVSGKFLVDDGVPAGQGQMTKSEFLSSLRSEVKIVAKQILEPVGLSQNECPDLNYWISFYQAKDAAYFESAIARYAPSTAGAENVGDYLSLLTDRVKEGLIEHVATGSHEVEPGEAPAELDEKRPDPSILTMQKKEAPIQFGVCASKADEDADKKKDDVKKEDAPKAEGKRGEEKLDLKDDPFNSTKVILERADEIRKLYTIEGKHIEIADILYKDAKQKSESKAAKEKAEALAAAAKEKPNLKRIEEAKAIAAEAKANRDFLTEYPDARTYADTCLNACSGAASALSMYVAGTDLTNLFDLQKNVKNDSEKEQAKAEDTKEKPVKDNPNILKLARPETPEKRKEARKKKEDEKKKSGSAEASEVDHKSGPEVDDDADYARERAIWLQKVREFSNMPFGKIKLQLLQKPVKAPTPIGAASSDQKRPEASVVDESSRSAGPGASAVATDDVKRSEADGKTPKPSEHEMATLSPHSSTATGAGSSASAGPSFAVSGTKGLEEAPEKTIALKGFRRHENGGAAETADEKVIRLAWEAKNGAELKAKRKADIDSTGYEISEEFTGFMSGGNYYMYLKITGLAHHFTILKLGDAFDLYESDRSPEGESFTEQTPPARRAINFLAGGINKNPVASQSAVAIPESVLSKRLIEILFRSKETAQTAEIEVYFKKL